MLALTSIALAAGAKSANAQAPLAVKLEFRAEQGCPDEQHFLSRLSSRASFRLVDEAAALHLRVLLATSASGARGELRAGDEGATDAREVEARSCSEVADALALIAVLMIERTKREQAERPPSVAPSKPAPPAPLPRQPPNPARRRQLELGLEAVASRPMAAAPLTGGGVSLFVAGSMTWWLSAHYSRNDVLRRPHDARFGFGAVTVGVGPAGLQLGPRLLLAAAVAMQGAFLSAEGVDVDVASSARRSYWGAGLEGRAQLEVVRHLGVFAEVGAFLPLVERRFSTLQPYELVGQTSRVAPHAALGFTVSL